MAVETWCGVTSLQLLELGTLVHLKHGEVGCFPGIVTGVRIQLVNRLKIDVV